MTIRRPTLWPLAVTVLSEFASFLPTPPADAGAVSSTSVFVTAAATVVPGKAGEPGGFLEASTPQPSDSPRESSPALVPLGQAESDVATFTKAADPADPDQPAPAEQHGAHTFPSREPPPVGQPRASTSNETRARVSSLLAKAGEPRPVAGGLPTTFQSLLESNSSVSNLLELSDEMLENATKLIAAAAAVDALQGKQLFPNSSLAVDARSATNEPVQPELRRREEATIKELADHSGKLQQLFNQLESDLVSDQGEDALDAHTNQPAAHKELAMAGIDDSEIPAALAEPSLNLRVGSPAPSSEEAEEENFRLLVTGLLLAVLLAVVGVGFCIYRYVLGTPRAVPVDETTGTTSDGTTSYVIRIVKARVRDLPSRTALAWQIHVGGENPRPSRFTKDALWDAPVDRLDVDVQDPREKISVAVLAASADGLEPPATLATVEVPAAVLLAEARGNKEKVANAGGDSAYVHEKKLALYPRGELVLDYSLIAFFHWYVGGEKDALRQ